jgi:parallel beta-helix repeat protein
MNHAEHEQTLGLPETARRNFLKQSSAVAVSVAFGSVALPALAAYVPPTRARGTTTRNVRNYGAYGDGRHDDTSAIQAAINSLPSTGGIVSIPAGTYLVDTTRRINLRSLMLLSLAPGAVLKAKTSSVRRAYILNLSNVRDVEIAGGQLVGERDTHQYVTGYTDEWNHGIAINGSARVTVRDIRISKCTGDGVCIGGASNDVVIANIIATQCRRQGLSITQSTNVRVYDSEFSYTQGTKPECGIDVEPDVPYSTSNVLIQNCWIHHNKANGVQIYKRTSAVTLRANTIEYNTGFGILAIGAGGGSLVSNQIRHNRLYGIGLRAASHHFTVSGNTFRNNKTMYFGVKTSTATPIKVTGVSTSTNPKTTWHMEITSDCYSNSIGTNYYAQ